MPIRPCNVLIAGAGVAGLTLALIFDKTGIDYTLLEAHPEILSKAGAGISMLTNGLRILDQLGCYEELLRVVEAPLDAMSIRSPDGEELTVADNLNAIFGKRYGYPGMWTDRKDLLRTIYEQIGDKSRLHGGKRIERVEHLQDSVKVHTADGGEYAADILIGVDGVHSQVRKEMHRRAAELGIADEYDDEEAIPATYGCVFGVSSSVPGAPQARSDFILNRQSSMIVASGAGDKTYWFFMHNLGKTFHGSAIPRFSAQDAEAVIQKHWDDRVTPTLRLSDLYKHKTEAVYTAMRENVYKKWYLDRVIVLGDAAHQMTSILGQGGNQAIESAAALGNALLRVLNGGSREGPLGVDEIRGVWGEVQGLRQPRVREVVKQCHQRQTMDAMETPEIEEMMLNKFPVIFKSMMLKRWDDNQAHAVSLDLLPVFNRPKEGSFMDEGKTSVVSKL